MRIICIDTVFQFDKYVFKPLRAWLVTFWQVVRQFPDAKDEENAPDNYLSNTIRDSLQSYEKVVDKDATPKDNFMNLLIMYFLKELHMREDYLSKEENDTIRNVIARSPRYKDQVRKSNKGRRKKK